MFFFSKHLKLPETVFKSCPAAFKVQSTEIPTCTAIAGILLRVTLHIHSCTCIVVPLISTAV